MLIHKKEKNLYIRLCTRVYACDVYVKKKLYIYIYIYIYIEREREREREKERKRNENTFFT
jgi:hypothetical protein